MDFRNGIAPFVEEGVYWKHESSDHSDVLELDFETDNRDDVLIRADGPMVLASNHGGGDRVGERFHSGTSESQSGIICTSPEHSRTANDEMMVTSSNERTDLNGGGEGATVPTGILLYRLFNQIIIDALLSTNPAGESGGASSNGVTSDVAAVVGNNEDLDTATPQDPLNSTQEWVDRHYLIFKSNALSGGGGNESIVTGDNRYVSNRDDSDATAGPLQNSDHLLVNVEPVVSGKCSSSNNNNNNNNTPSSLADAQLNIGVITDKIIAQSQIDESSNVQLTDTIGGKVVGDDDDVQFVAAESFNTKSSVSCDTDSVMTSRLETESVTDGEDDVLSSKSDRFAGRCTVIDKDIINYVFECFKRKLVDTINIEILNTLKVDKVDNGDMSSSNSGNCNDDDYEVDCDMVIYTDSCKTIDNDLQSQCHDVVESKDNSALLLKEEGVNEVIDKDFSGVEVSSDVSSLKCGNCCKRKFSVISCVLNVDQNVNNNNNNNNTKQSYTCNTSLDKLCCVNVCKNHKSYNRNKNFDCNMKLRYKCEANLSNIDGSCTKDVKLVCRVCHCWTRDDAAFNEHLESHWRAGTGNVQCTVCNYCDKLFFVRSVYVQHVVTCHAKHVCDVCTELFDSDVALNDHTVRCVLECAAGDDSDDYRNAAKRVKLMVNDDLKI